MIKRIPLIFSTHFLVVQSFFSFCGWSESKPITRFVEPPKLGKKNIGERLIGYRPVRKGAPRMDVEVKKNGQIIAHNYGHGGSGWTLAPGGADYVNGKLVELLEKNGISKNEPITIIGAGVIGLFSAYDLVQKGFTNIVIVADAFENLTSDVAGGLISPASMDNDPHFQGVVDQIGIKAYKFFEEIVHKKHPYFLEGAIQIPAYFETRSESGLELYVKYGLMPPPKDVVLDFANGTKRKMVEYEGAIFVDTPIMMLSLKGLLKERGVLFKKKKITSLDEVSTKAVINCSGLGAKELLGDQKLGAVQGHLILLKDQNPDALNQAIVIRFPMEKTRAGLNRKRAFYIFPKKILNRSNENDIGVIGGTFIEEGVDTEESQEEFSLIISRAKRFYGIE